MKKISTLTLVLALAAGVASAQMMGGGGRGMPGYSPRTGTIPFSDLGGMMAGLFGTMTRGAMDGHGIVVTPDGTVIVTRAADPDGDGTYEAELVALTPAGTKAWSRSLSGLGVLLGVSNDLVLTVNRPASVDFGNAFATTLAAYDAATGGERWTLALDGIPMGMEPFDGGTYLTVVTRTLTDVIPTPGSRHGMGSVELWSVDQTGTVRWKYPLTE